MSEHGHDSHGDGHGDSHGSEEHAEEHEEHSEEEHSHKEHGHDGHEDHGHESHSDSHGAGQQEQKQEKPKEKNPPLNKQVNEFEVLMLLVIAVFGRLLLKEFPDLYSIEPIIPIAVYAGLRFGTNAGVIVGLLAYPVSNVFLEGGAFGLYSVLQGAAGAVSGGLAGNSKLSANNLLYFTFIGTLFFEVLLNIGDGALLIWPFSIRHIVSNLVFAAIIGVFVKEK